MKILSVNCFYPPFEPSGGATVYAHSLNKAYQLQGHKVEVFCGKLAPEDTLYHATIDTYDGLKTTRINLNYQSFDLPLKRIVGDRNILAEFIKVLKNFKPDLVHFHAIQGLGAELVKYTINQKIKTIVTVHDSWWLCPRQFFLKSDKKTFCRHKNYVTCSLCHACLEEKSSVAKNIRKEAEILTRDNYLYSIFSNIDLVIFPSKFLFNIYQKHLPVRNWHISQNGIPKNNLIPNLDKKTKIKSFLFVGGNSKEKGSDLLLSTWNKFFSNRKDIKLNIYGAGSTELAGKIKSKNIIINDVYNRSQVKQIFQSNQVLIFPSIIPENSPITIKEAFSYGLPVIGSDIGGIPELINDGNNGYLFPSNNSDLLAKKINEMVTNIGLQMRQNAVESYSTISNQAKEIISYYQNINPIVKKTIKHKLFNFVCDSLYLPSKSKNNNKPIDFTIYQKSPIDLSFPNLLLFNLSQNRNKFLIDNYQSINNIPNGSIFEIYKPDTTPILDKNNLLLNNSQITNWIKISKFININKINILVLPFPEIKYFKLINRIIFIFFGIRYFILFEKKPFLLTFNPKFRFNIHSSFTNDIENLYYILKRIVIYILSLPFLILFSLVGLIFTPYGISRIFHKLSLFQPHFKGYTMKQRVFWVLLIPLKTIRYLTNYFLYNFLLS